MIGGTTSWIGPLIGAILLGTLQQVATVTISSAVNLLIVGVLLVALRHHRAERHRRAGAGLAAPRRQGASDRAAARGQGSASASAASSRSTASISPCAGASASA